MDTKTETERLISCRRDAVAAAHQFIIIGDPAFDGLASAMADYNAAAAACRRTTAPTVRPVENNTVTRMHAAVDAVGVECSPAHADRLRAAVALGLSEYEIAALKRWIALPTAEVTP